MKIVQLLPFRFWGGPESQSFQMAAQLKNETGIATEFLFYTSPQCSKSDFDLLREKALIYNLNFTLRPSPTPINLFSERRFVADYVKSFNLAVSSGYVCDLLLVFQQIKKISIVHGLTAQNFKVRLYEKLDQLLLRFFDAVACVSIKQKIQLAEKRVHAFLLSNSLDLKPPLLPVVERAEYLPNVQVIDSNQLLLSVGRLSPEKGHSYLLKAFSEVLTTDRNAHLILIGDGSEKDRLLTLAADLKIKDHVHFLGKKDNAIRWMKNADLFILPSDREGLPVVLLEAISQQLPVVCTAVGGNTEIIFNQQTGLLVDPAKPLELARQIQWALRNKEKMQNYAANAFEHIKLNFSLKKQCDQWQEIIKYATAK